MAEAATAAVAGVDTAAVEETAAATVAKVADVTSLFEVPRRIGAPALADSFAER